MSNPSPTCPFCNASLLAVMREGDKAHCPRCNEPLPAALIENLPTANAATNTEAKPITNRRMGMYILGGMGVMALAALVFALLTQAQRRARDPKRPEVIVQPPTELAAMHYLPRETNFALGVHVASILNDPDAAKLLEEPYPAMLDWVLNTVKKRTGMTLREVDHFILGTELDVKLPTLVLVVQTHRPYSLGDIQKAMLPATATVHEGQPLYRFPTPPFGEAFLWCRAPKTLIFLWRPESVDRKDLATIPKGNAVDPVPPPLADFMTKRLEKQSLMWLVGDFSSLSKLQMALEPLRILPQFKNVPGIPEPWRSIQFAGLSLVNETRKDETPRTLTLRGQFQTIEPLVSEFVGKHLKSFQLPGQVSNRVTPPPSDAAGADRWVLWQVRMNVEELRKSLR